MVSKRVVLADVALPQKRNEGTKKQNDRTRNQNEGTKTERHNTKNWNEGTFAKTALNYKDRPLVSSRTMIYCLRGSYCSINLPDGHLCNFIAGFRGHVFGAHTKTLGVTIHGAFLAVFKFAAAPAQKLFYEVFFAQ